MGIDGIGKPPGVPPPGAAGISGTTAPARGEAFQVRGPTPIDRTALSPELEQLQRGELSLEQYVDARVQEAVAHLDGKMATEQIDFIKATLREQIEADPLLAELMRRATGASPPEPEH